MQDLLVPLLSVTMESVEKDEDAAALKSLIDLAESVPKYLRPQLGQLFEACTRIFADKEKNESMRNLALEIIVTLAETAPAMVRKVAGQHLANAIQVRRRAGERELGQTKKIGYSRRGMENQTGVTRE